MTNPADVLARALRDEYGADEQDAADHTDAGERGE